MAKTYYRSSKTGLYFDGPGSRNIVPDPTKIQPSAPLVGWGIAIFILGAILIGVGAAIPADVDFFGNVSDPGAGWTVAGIIAQALGGITLAVGAYRAAVGIDSTHRLARFDAIKDRIEELD